MDFSTVLHFVQEYGPWGITAFVTFFFLRLLLDEDRSALWRGRFYKLAFRLTGKTEHEKKYISNDVKGRLNLARRRMHYGKILIPEAADIAWVAGAGGSTADIGEGEFIVRLDPSEDQKKNIVILASAIVGRTSLIGVRRCVERALETALDINLIKNLLESLDRTVLDWFLKEEYPRVVSLDADTKDWNDKIAAIDEKGLFTRLLLVELEDFSREVAGKPFRPYMAGEIEDLIHFLFKICTKQVGEKVPLDYRRAFIRIGVIIVAKTSTFLGQGTAPYVAAMQRNMVKEVSAVYVLIFDKEWLGETDPEAHRVFLDQVIALDGDFVRQTVATKDFELKYSCVDQRGVRRDAKLIRYVHPTLKNR